MSRMCVRSACSPFGLGGHAHSSKRALHALGLSELAVRRVDGAGSSSAQLVLWRLALELDADAAPDLERLREHVLDARYAY